MEECKKINMRTTRSNVESCSLIFAIINIILAAMSIIVTTQAVYSEMAYISHYFGRQERTENMDITLSVLMMTFIVAMTLSLVGFAFSIILVMGVFQRKAGYVKAYFVFGIIATVITFMCSVALILLVQDVDIYTIYFYQGGCMVYLAILAMIWITHQRIEKIEKDNQSSSVEIGKF
ncbi:hypothetical protein O0L34_g13887 [Tuta absoluta]|nr:hypothetical protein O0L34_g13887 [Tuta absoluta]